MVGPWLGCRQALGLSGGPCVCPPVLEGDDWALESEPSPVALPHCGLWVRPSPYPHPQAGVSLLLQNREGSGPSQHQAVPQWVPWRGSQDRREGPLHPPPRSQASPAVLVPGLDLRVREVE